LITYSDYSVFNGPDFMAGATPQQKFESSNDRLSNHVGPENQDRALLLRGCPWRVTKEEI
jgi:hypothetical protein